LDLRLQNYSHVTTDGADLDLEHTWQSTVGNWHAQLRGTYVDRYLVRQGADVQELANTVGKPLRVRTTAAVGWSQEGLGATLSAEYTGGYHDISSDRARNVRSWLTFDVRLWKKFGKDDAGTISNCEISLGVHNLFGRTPPFATDPVGLGFDTVNANQFGRQFVLELTTRT
jgi:hypothetical protein